MSISDAEYKEWLLAEGVRRCVLVEMWERYYNAGTGSTSFGLGRYSNLDYISGSNTYDNRVRDIPTFKVGMSDNIGFGELVLDNQDGALDYLFGTLDTNAVGIDGCEVVIYLGDPGWAQADFRPWLTGLVDDISSATESEIRIAIRDRGELLNGPIQPNFYTSGPAQGRHKPLCFGRVVNIEPVLIDEVNLTYQIHDGAIGLALPSVGVLVVRDRGVIVTVTPHLSTGTFDLVAAPVGRITALVDGHQLDTSYHRCRYVDLVTEVVTRRGGSSADIDGLASALVDAALVDLYSADPVNPKGNFCGVYLTEKVNARDLLAEYLNPIEVYWYWSRTGLLTLWLRAEPAATPVDTVTGDIILSMSLLRREPPVRTIQVGAFRHYTILDADALAATVSAENRANWARTWEYTRVATNSGLDAHLGAVDQSAEDLGDFGDFPQKLADYKAALRSKPRAVWALELALPRSPWNMGDTIAVDYPARSVNGNPRFNFGSVNVVIIGIEERPLANRTTLEIWL